MKLHTFKIIGNGVSRYSGKHFRADKKKVLIDAKDKATAIIEFLTQHPEYSNKIICDLAK